MTTMSDSQYDDDLHPKHDLTEEELTLYSNFGRNRARIPSSLIFKWKSLKYVWNIADHYESIGNIQMK